jgi:polyhydroxybutyrate depolymerase
MGSGSAGGATCPVTATAKPGETNESIMVGGMNRTYVLHIPPKYDGKTPLPVIFDYHPLGGTGSSQKSLSGWGTLADDKGIIVVWPDGIGNSWNVGRCCSTAQSQKIDDVAFTKAILTALEKQACIDAKRVYATGCSNGGGMAFKIACDAANVIAAVAPVDFDCVTGAAANPSCGSCMPARPISELQFRGTSDTAVPYAGGSGPAGTLFPGAEENFSEWKDINQCTGSAAPLADHAACSTYPTCEGGVQTVLCTVQNGTHCGNYKSFDIINIAWEMFQKETLP